MTTLTMDRAARRSLADLTDEALVEASRDGDNNAYAVLWQRHSGAARRAARAITSKVDPDDLVSEAFTKVLSAIRSGGGPRDSFRAYLFTTLRHVSMTWGKGPQDVQLDYLEDVPDSEAEDAVSSLDQRSLLVAAFAELPERTRTLLWYLEVEGMRPREIAPLLGLSPNAVSAAAIRAREAFRQAWLAAHIADPGRPAECRWVCERLVRAGAKPIPRADRPRFDAHVEDCSRCTLAIADLSDASSKLRSALLALVLGGSAAAAYSAAAPPPAASAAIIAVRRLPWAIGAGVAAVLLTVTAVSAGTGIPGGTPSTADGEGDSRPVAPTAAGGSPTGLPSPRRDGTSDPSATPSPSITPGRFVPQPTPSSRPPVFPSLPPLLPSPSATPRIVAPLAFAWEVPHGTEVPPLLIGTAHPGAVVSARDESGVQLARALVGADGAFAMDISGDLLRQGMTVTLEHIHPEAGVVGTATAIGPLTFSVPALADVVDGVPIQRVDGDGDGEADDVELALLTASGSTLHVSVDGAPAVIVAPSPGGDVVVLVDVALGEHDVRIRFTDADGRLGVAVAETIVVAAGGVSP